MGSASPPSIDYEPPTPAIETTVAYVWAIFMTLVTLVLSYYGFVVARRHDREVEPAAEGTASVSGTEA